MAEPEPSETTQAPLDPEDPTAAELLGAVRALSVQVGGLQAELRALRAETRELPSAADAPGWDSAQPARREKSAWMRSLDRPGSRQPAVPRLLLEVLFLAAVAAAAAIAQLEPAVVVAVMAVSWVLVAVAEWLAAQSARRHAEMSTMPLAGTSSIFADDPSWFAPPLERVSVDGQDSGRDDIEDTAHGEEHATAPRLPPRSGDE